MRKRPTNVGDIDAIYSALRPRLDKLRSGAVISKTITTAVPHTHPAVDISYEPVGLISGENCQITQEELSDEKLARSGEQEMLGDLPMAHHSINDIHDADIEGTATVGEDVVFTEGVGGAIINNPRVIHMVGDHVDDEAKVDGLERMVFNDEPTASTIEVLSRTEWNKAVTPGTDYTLVEGQTSWSDLEDNLVVIVKSGAA